MAVQAKGHGVHPLAPQGMGEQVRHLVAKAAVHQFRAQQPLFTVPGELQGQAGRQMAVVARVAMEDGTVNHVGQTRGQLEV
ncbi:hypothetical protein FQZ97_1013710 [compost metagenome]